MRVFLSTFIKFYKSVVSPHLKSCQCKYYPTCSDYALLALTKYGVFAALKKILIRLIKCNPWNHGGIDFP